MCSVAAAAAIACPSNTIVGTATAISPLLPDPLSGNVYIVQGIRTNAQGQQIKTLPSLLIPLKGDIELILRAQTCVAARVSLITTFPGIPDAAVSNFKLTINGGCKGILVVTGRGESICKSAQNGTGQLTAHSRAVENLDIHFGTPACGSRRPSEARQAHQGGAQVDMRRLASAAAAILCAAAAGCLSPAGAVAASGLAWSTPVLVDNQGPFAVTTEVRGMSCPTTSLCVGVGPDGTVVTTLDASDGPNATWAVAGVDGHNTIQAISCLDSPSLCVAVDQQGNVVASTDPQDGVHAQWTVTKVDSVFNPATSANAGLTSVSCVSSSLLCVAVDDNGDVVTSTDPDQGASATWTLSDIDTANAVNSLSGVSCVTSTFCLAVDANGNVLGSADAGTGTAAHWLTSNVDGTTSLKSISCTSAALCVAVDGNGNALTSTTGGASWSSLDIDGTTQMRAVSCVSSGTDLCAAVDVKGNGLTTTDPGDGAAATWAKKKIDQAGFIGIPFPVAISCPSTSFCVASDNGGRAVTTSDPADGTTATWTTKAINGANGINGMSCPSASLCVAVDKAGNTLTSADPGDGAGATWALEPLESKTSLTAVSCPSTSLCIAVDNKGNVLTSADPGDGATATWATLDIDGTRIVDSVSCPSASLCVAVDDDGNVFTTTDPADGANATWTTSNVDQTNTINGVSCPSESLCVAGDNQGNVLVSTDPADGASATWTVSDVDLTNGVLAISCPSQSLCVAGDDQGNALTSTDPADGAAGVWTSAAADSVIALNAVSCPSSSACTAVDARGNAVSSADPGDGATAVWSVTDVDGNTGLTSLACLSSTLCVAGDQIGDALVGAAHTLTVATDGDGSGTVSSADGSISCPTLCSDVEPSGSEVVLTATPAAGSSFTGWSGGGCPSGTTTTCTVTMDSDQSVTATFAPTPKPLLTVTTAGSGSGAISSDDASISCPESCSHRFDSGTTVNLTATPSDGSSFTGWSGGGCSGTGPCSVHMNGDQDVTATFTANTTSTPPPTGGGGQTGGGGGGSVTTPVVVPKAKPSCTLKPDSPRVSARQRTHRTRDGKLKPVAPKRTLSLTARCDQSARLTLAITVTSVRGPAHGAKRHVSTYHLSAPSVQSRAGAPMRITVKLPRAALGSGVRDSVTAVLRAVNANGSSKATAKIGRLILV